MSDFLVKRDDLRECRVAESEASSIEPGQALLRVELEAGVADAWHPFCEWAGGWLETIQDQCFEGVRSAYLDVLEGHVDPKHAHLITLTARG
jgi:hypothetical protein